MNRRRLLTGFAATIAGTAGCLNYGGQANQSAVVRLQRLEVLNRTKTRHVVHVLVFHDGALENWSSHEADPFNDETQTAGGGVVEQTWPDSPGTVEIYARLDDAGEWETLNLAEAVDGRCAEAFVVIDDRGLTLWHTNACPAGEN